MYTVRIHVYTVLDLVRNNRIHIMIPRELGGGDTVGSGPESTSQPPGTVRTGEGTIGSGAESTSRPLEIAKKGLTYVYTIIQ